MAQASALYLGTVHHRRHAAPEHAFSYRVWYALLDLDELPLLAARIPGFAHNRLALAGFHDRDHMGPSTRPVRAKLAEWLAAAGVTEAPARVELLTQPRVLGLGFNPVSFYYCRDRDDVLRQVVAEVNNTFGEACCYLLRADGAAVREEAAKRFHVSPFQPLAGRYAFRLTPPGERLEVGITLERDGRPALETALVLERRDLSAANLRRAVLRAPHAGLRNLALIHLQALRLWLRGAPFFPKPGAPAGAWRTRGG
jgi:hypothetical protein